MHQTLDETPYWLAPRPLTRSYSGKTLPRQTDVLVIGGGFTGISTALHLRRQDVQVTVIDQDQFCFNASARNGGMALTGLSEGIFTVEKRFGAALARDFFKASIESVACVEGIVDEGRIACDFNRYGNLVAAFKPSHFEELKHEQAFLSEKMGYETRLVPPRQMETEVDTRFYHGGLIDPLGAGVHPAKYIAGLVQMAEDAGAGLHEGVKALSIKKHRGRYSVSTDAGRMEAGQVVMATNGYTDGLVPWLQRRMIPVESFMIATEPLPDDMAGALIPKGRMIFDTKNLLYYFRLSPDGRRMLFGGRPRSMRLPYRQRAESIRRDMVKVFPQLETFSIDYAWYGNCGFTFDRFPHIGRHQGLTFAMGYCGHGVAMATHLGKEAADLVTGRGDGGVFANNSFFTVPFYRGKPWFTPLAHAYFKLRDKTSLSFDYGTDLLNLYFRLYDKLM